MPALELVLAGFLLVSTLQAVRFLPYFAIAWCALAARCSPLPEERIRPTLLVWPLLAVLGLSLLQGPWWPAGTPAASVPVRAVHYLEHQPGRVFSTYLWNDYLDYVGIPVFVDGRTELYTSGPRSPAVPGGGRSDQPRPTRSCAHTTSSTSCGPTDSALSFYLRRRHRMAGGVAILVRPRSSGTRSWDATTAQPVNHELSRCSVGYGLPSGS